MVPLRILIAERHPGVRQGIKMLLEQHPNWYVVAQADNGDDAIQQALTQRPNVVIMDVRIPGQSSEAVCNQILHHLPNTKVIILTTLLEDSLLPAVLRAGAVGYILKQIGGHDLVNLIEQIS